MSVINSKEIKQEFNEKDAIMTNWNREFLRNSVENKYKSEEVIDTKIDTDDMIYEKALYKCNNCKYQSEFYSSFVVHADACEESADLMTDIKNYKSTCSENGSFTQEYDICDIKDEIVIEDMRFERVHYDCSNCDFVSESYCAYQVHISSCRETLAPPSNSINICDVKDEIVTEDMIFEKVHYDCSNCGFGSESYCAYQVHISCHCKMLNTPSKSINIFDVKDEIVTEDMIFEKMHYDCINCDFGSESYCAYQVHISSCCKSLDPPNKPRKDFKCNVCKESFGTRYELTVHYRLHRKPKLKNKPQSKVYDKKFQNKYRIRAEKQFECTICSETFRYANYLAHHIKKHSMEKRFRCNVCQKKFMWKANLKWHIRTHHGKYVSHEKLDSKKNITRQVDNHSTKFCHICQNTFKCDIMTESGSSNAENKSFVCSLCQKDSVKCDIVSEQSCIRKRSERISALKQQVKTKSTQDKIKHECKVCRKIYSEKSSLVVHTKAVHNKIKYKCEICDKKFSMKKSVVIHIKSVHNHVRYKCEICYKMFSCKRYLNLHIDTIHNEITIECKVCNKTFINSSSLNVHMISVHDKIKYKCEICHRMFSHKNYLNMHLKAIHDEIRSECKICHKTFIRDNSLKIHMNSVHIKIKHQCEKCYKTFSTKGSLVIHMGKVHGNIKYECEICCKTFSEKKSVAIHIQSIHNNVRYECEICHKLFSCKRYLQFHVKAIHNEIRIECTICNKTFIHNGALNSHTMSIHDKVKHECEFCHKTFTRKNYLKLHVKAIHNKIGTECKLCYKKFVHDNGLRIHMKAVHCKIRHECEVCNKTFSAKNTLDVHKRSVHSSIKLECDICHKAFSWRKSFVTHMSSKHGKIIS